MQIPSTSDPRWRDVVTGKRQISFDYLALKVYLIQSKMELARDASPQAVNQKVTEFREMFIANATHPKVQADLLKIFE